MIEASDFVDVALAKGLRFWTGVPCSFLTPFINFVSTHPELDYVDAVNEGDAIGIAAGAHLAGQRSVVMFQNSGLGNAVNPLTSLSATFRIPCLIVVTHRGAPGIADEPQHEVMGEITGKLLDTLGIPFEAFPSRADDIADVLTRALDHMDREGTPYALLMAKGAVAKVSDVVKREARDQSHCSVAGDFSKPPADRMSRIEAMEIVREVAADSRAIVASTGKIGRELFALGHRPNQFYMVGSMGCASAIGLGLCAAGNRSGALVIDGDGALLMRMGSLASIGYHRPSGLWHIVLDNEAHESTGGQPTVSLSTDFAAIASACGYRSATKVDTPEALRAAIEQLHERPGPHLIHVKVSVGSAPDLPRPDRSPTVIRQEFVQWLNC